MSEERNYYQVLMVAEDADAEIIAVVRRALAKRYHPDVDPTPEAAQRMVLINEAYQVLSDPQRRARYDTDLASRRNPQSAERTGSGAARGAYGPAGAPPGPAQGSVINIGRYSGWSLGQIKRYDPAFLEWLMTVPAGRQYRDEIRAMLGRRA